MYTASKDENAKEFDAIKTNAKDIKDTAYEAGKKIRSAANDSAEKVGKFFKDAGDEACSAAKNVSAKIEENPKQAVIVSLVAGFLLGALFRR